MYGSLTAKSVCSNDYHGEVSHVRVKQTLSMKIEFMAHIKRYYRASFKRSVLMRLEQHTKSPAFSWHPGTAPFLLKTEHKTKSHMISTGLLRSGVWNELIFFILPLFVEQTTN